MTKVLDDLHGALGRRSSSFVFRQEASMAHANAPLSFEGRRRLIERCQTSPAWVTDRIRNGRREHKWSAQWITHEFADIGFTINRRTVTRHLNRLGLGKRRFIDSGGENNRKPGKTPPLAGPLADEKGATAAAFLTREGMVRRARHQPHPPNRHRQRRLLSIRRLCPDRRPTDPASQDQAVQPSPQRKGRAV
ncbi:hypothetical protein [Streptomyces sp. PU-14G]|uniref:hypothetical protein n=1 Tax=Streptomyces sp. PU-14G TaxID=2800808 RepID=UPI0034DEB285